MSSNSSSGYASHSDHEGAPMSVANALCNEYGMNEFAAANGMPCNEGLYGIDYDDGMHYIGNTFDRSSVPPPWAFQQPFDHGMHP